MSNTQEDKGQKILSYLEQEEAILEQEVQGTDLKMNEEPSNIFDIDRFVQRKKLLALRGYIQTVKLLVE